MFEYVIVFVGWDIGVGVFYVQFDYWCIGLFDMFDGQVYFVVVGCFVYGVVEYVFYQCCSVFV